MLTLNPDDRRRGQVLADIMRREIGVEIQLDPVDNTVLGERRDRLDFDLLVQNSGGDFDPDDGLVDFMTTESKFNANARDKAEVSRSATSPRPRSTAWSPSRA